MLKPEKGCPECERKISWNIGKRKFIVLGKTENISTSSETTCYDLCMNEKYKGQHCDCADCRHEVGVCIDHDSGNGCAACDGPVNDCDLTGYR